MSDQPKAQSLSFRPDMLTEAMAATAGAYFLGRQEAESHHRFRESIHDLVHIKKGPLAYIGKPVLAAGLRAAGFKIQLDPLSIDPPDKDPDLALDQYTFQRYGHQVVPTLVDMGLNVTTRGTPEYSEEITRFVMYEIH